MPDRNQILLNEYGILVDLIKHQHTRVQDFYKIFLTANTILIGACAILLKNGDIGDSTFILPFCLIGIVISLVWASVLQRINVDSDLRWYQLRYLERELQRDFGIFTSGKTFFDNGWLEAPDKKEAPLVFPKCIKGKLSKFRVVSAGLYLPLVFGSFYGILIVVNILN